MSEIIKTYFINNTSIVSHKHCKTQTHAQPHYFSDAHVFGSLTVGWVIVVFILYISPEKTQTLSRVGHPNILFNTQTHTHIYCTCSLQRAAVGLGGRKKQRFSEDTADIWAVLSGIYWTVYTLLTVLRNLIDSWVIGCLGLLFFFLELIITIINASLKLLIGLLLNSENRWYEKWRLVVFIFFNKQVRSRSLRHPDFCSSQEAAVFTLKHFWFVILVPC